MNDPKTLSEWALFYTRRGWPVMPLHTPSEGGGCSCHKGKGCASPGKHPRILTGKDHANASTDPGMVQKWWELYPEANIGIVTGTASGLVVVDVDPKNGGERPEELPDTIQVLTGSGGSHDYYGLPDGAAPRKRILTTGVDFQAEGGLVVAPPSLHSSGRRYEWEVEGDPRDRGVAPMPAWLLEAGNRSRPAPPPLEDGETVQAGGRNLTLTRIAGALRRQGADADSIEAALGEVNSRKCSPPLPAAEVRSIARSVTRYAPVPDEEPERLRAPALVPGVHSFFDEDGKPVTREVREDDFANEVLSKIEPGALYRRAGAPGRIIEGEFKQIRTEEMILVVARHVALESKKLAKKGQSTFEQRKFEPCSQSRAALVRAHAGESDHVRDARRIVPYPVYTGNFELAAPGWNEASGTLCLFEGKVERGGGRAAIDDALVDWPWASEADRANAVAMLLTPLVRPAVRGNVPLFLVEASLERTGKTKLASDFLGRLFLGRATPAMQFAEREEEVDKRIIAALMQGSPILNLDNLGKKVASPSLAALLTSESYTGRKLGVSENVTLRNEMTLVATGNNVAASNEIAKRVVPMRLHPPTASPELRTDFVHPDLIAFVEGSRGRLLGALIDLVEAWLAAGRPASRKALGGYEGWASVVGGILEVAGYHEWLDNRRAWVGEADSEDLDLERFLEVWFRSRGTAEVKPVDLLGVAESEGLFPWVLSKVGESGRAVSLARTVLAKLRDRPIGNYVMRTRVRSRRTFYSLQVITPETPSEARVSRDARDHGTIEVSEECISIHNTVGGATEESREPPQTRAPSFWDWVSEKAARLNIPKEMIARKTSMEVLGREGPQSVEDEEALDAWVAKL